MIAIGSVAPDFCLMNQDKAEVCLHDFEGRWVVLYFYPKDNTSGCTKEAVDFTGHLDEYESLNAEVIGISPDPVKSHWDFIRKHNLKVTLLADPEYAVLEKYGVWQKKRQYGREYYGVARTTYLINPEGKIEKVWENVKVDGHANSVMCDLQDLQK